MKNLISTITTILLTSTIWSTAQVVPINVGSYPGDPSGEQIGHQLFVKLNYDLAWLQNQTTNLQAQLTALQAQGQPTNVVLSSTTVSLLNSNPFVFNGTSNYLGSFTNVFSLTCVAGANLLTNVMSVDGGATWLPYASTNPITQLVLTNFWTNLLVTNILWTTNISGTNYTLTSLGTNFTTITNIYTNLISGPVQIAVLSGTACTGSVSVASLADPSLQGRYYDFAGETLHIPQADTNAAFIAALQVQIALLNTSMITNLNYRSGITNIPTLTTSQAVLFSTPFSPTIGTNYSVSVSFDTALAAAVGFSTTSKTTNGFTITLSGTITGAVQVDYVAWPYQ